MIQQLLIAVVFAGSLVFLGRMVFRAFQARHACATGCSKCGAVDFAKIEKQINAGVAPVRKK